MFNKESNKNKEVQGTGSGVNIIGQGTQIEGNIISNGDIRIEGLVKGTVSSKAKIVIGSTGKIIGDIFAANADISGEITGTLKINDLLSLKASSRVNGDLYSKKLIIEQGAQFNGKCHMNSDQANNFEMKQAGVQNEKNIEKQGAY